MKTTSYTCDGCGEAMEGDGSFHRNDMLVLSVEQMPTKPSIYVNDMYITPKLPRPHHFCRFACLDMWMQPGHPSLKKEARK